MDELVDGVRATHDDEGRPECHTPLPDNPPTNGTWNTQSFL